MEGGNLSYHTSTTRKVKIAMYRAKVYCGNELFTLVFFLLLENYMFCLLL